MKTLKRFSFSLLTLFLLTSIVALSVSHVVTVRQLREANSEIKAVRKAFGYVRVVDPKRIYLARIEGREDSRNKSYRMHIPPGHLFMMRVSEATFSADGEPMTFNTLQNKPIKSWRAGGDVILTWGIHHDADGTPRVQVYTDSEPLFNYRLEGWKQPKSPNSVKHLDDGQLSFSPADKIRFVSWWNGESERGVTLWLELLGP